MQKPYQPKYLQRWHETINFIGEDFTEYFIASWRIMRVGRIERSNHKYIKEHLLDSVPADQSHLIQVASFSDEVYITREYVFVHESCERGLRMADMFAKRLRSKKELDPGADAEEGLYEVQEAWVAASLRAKIRLCRAAGVSIFGARKKFLLDDAFGAAIYKALHQTDYQFVELSDE